MGDGQRLWIAARTLGDGETLWIAVRILGNGKTLRESARDLHGKVFLWWGAYMHVPFFPSFTHKMTSVGGGLRYWYTMTTRLMIQTHTRFQQSKPIISVVTTGLRLWISNWDRRDLGG